MDEPGRSITGSRRRTVFAGLVVGLLLTAASLAIGADVSRDPSGNGYHGDARLLGYPWPFTYVITSETSVTSMEVEVSCTVTWPLCRYPAPSARIGLVYLIGDWVIWTALVGVALAVGTLTRRRRLATTAASSAGG